MRPGPGDWTCLGPRPDHPVDLERVETPHPSFSREVAIERCRKCGQLYRYDFSEISDWSGDRDYSDETRNWIAIEEDEIEAVRADRDYQPRGDRRHQHHSGWKAD